MENIIQKLILLLAKFMVIGFFTLLYVTPLYMLFHLIIFQNFELLDEITIKSYSISYLIGFVIIYVNMEKSVENGENKQ